MTIYLCFVGQLNEGPVLEMGLGPFHGAAKWIPTMISFESQEFVFRGATYPMHSTQRIYPAPCPEMALMLMRVACCNIQRVGKCIVWVPKKWKASHWVCLFAERTVCKPETSFVVGSKQALQTESLLPRGALACSRLLKRTPEVHKVFLQSHVWESPTKWSYVFGSKV